MRTKTDQGLKAKVEAEVTSIIASSVERGGWKSDLVNRFSKQGAGASTLYRWIDAFRVNESLIGVPIVVMSSKRDENQDRSRA
jgi:hypothetical protein